MKKLCIKTLTGVAIMTLLDDSKEAECLQKWQDINPGQYVSHREITDADIPADRSKRHLWRDNQPGPQIDIDPDPPPPVPQIISRFQGRMMLKRDGMLNTVKTMMESADEDTQLAWHETVEWHRDSPMVNAFATGLGKTEAELDDFFREGILIKA